ncbi:MAG TPA: adenylate/guanylate cyclase domain-containing protein [Thermoanaerobaculia bacterium]
MLRLRFVLEGQERVVPLVRDLRLGRGADNDLVLPDSSVSRHHADLRRAGDGWVVEDARSTNGVQVNRLPVQRAPLHPGDRLTVGVFEFAVELSAPAPARPPLPPPAEPPTAVAPLVNATLVRPLADFEKRQALDQAYENRIFGYMTRLARLLLASDAVDEVLDQVLDLAFEALPVDRGFILLCDEEAGGELVCELARSKGRREFRPEGEVPVSRTMLQAVMSERVALVTHDAQADARLAGGESVRIHQIRAAMCAPLWSEERIIGVVQVDSPFQVGAFTERDLDFLTALANYAAVAIERLRYARQAEFERQVRSRLERYHSPAVIEEALRAGAEGDASRRLRVAQATVLFADLAGFTPFAEHAPPEEVAELLDAYFNRAVDAVFTAGGTLDKFIGDCVMAFFGAPVPQADHAVRAVRAAVRLREALAEWNAERAALGQPPYLARIGINSGPVVVGDIGSSRRVDYTVLGNTVNVASRLEALVARPGDIVLGPETHRLLAGAFPTEPLGELQLRGLQQRIIAHRVLVPGPVLAERGAGDGPPHQGPRGGPAPSARNRRTP